MCPSVALRCLALPFVVTPSFTFDCIDVVLCRADIIESGILVELQGIDRHCPCTYNTAAAVFAIFVSSVCVCVC